ncbi:MAG TPA: nickel-binding protein [Trebonia sp.]|jgi:hypothetical protein
MAQDSAAGRPRYLAEWYQSALTEERLAQTERQIGRSAAELSAKESPVRVLVTLFMPDDEVAFCLFAAGSPTLVEQACRRAGIPLSRVTRAITSPDVSRQ